MSEYQINYDHSVSDKKEISHMREVIKNYEKLVKVLEHEIQMLRSIVKTPQEVVDRINDLSPSQLRLIVDKQVEEMIDESERD